MWKMQPPLSCKGCAEGVICCNALVPPAAVLSSAVTLVGELSRVRLRHTVKRLPTKISANFPRFLGAKGLLVRISQIEYH